MARDGGRRGRAEPDGRWYEVLARVGLVASALIGLLLALTVGGLATNTYEQSSTDAGVQGAFRLLRDRPLGVPLLWALGAACALHAGWRAIQAVTDRSAHGWTRAAWAAVAVAYAVLTALAWSIAVGSPDGGSSGGTQRAFTARVLDWPGGRLLVGAVGVGVLAAGAGLVWWAGARRFEGEVDERGLARRWRAAGRAALVAGYAARGLVVAVVGAFVVHSAVQHDPGAGQGLDGALAELAGEPWGPAALWLVAVALVLWTVAAALRVVLWDVADRGRLGQDR